MHGAEQGTCVSILDSGFAYVEQGNIALQNWRKIYC
jgi:hypothetical protein